MRIQADHDLEKAEVALLLASGIFSRAPNLVQILTYICAKYFEGLPEEIKEYNIAVEALGRPPDFDQKRDSIVRVEAHRLRKRLREYYENEGAQHACQIEIPPGQYPPRFVLREESKVLPVAGQPLLEPATPAQQVEVLTPALEPVPVTRRKRWPAVVVVAGGAILLTLLLTSWPMGRTTAQTEEVGCAGVWRRNPHPGWCGHGLR